MLMILHPDEKIEFAAMFESFLSIGFALGPLIGSVLYYLVGYFLMFAVVSMFFLIFIIPLIITMPSNIN